MNIVTTMGPGFTMITLLCIGGLVLIALVMMFAGGGDTTRAMDDVYARRQAAEPSGGRSGTDADEPVSSDERRREPADTPAGRSSAAEAQRDAA